MVDQWYQPLPDSSNEQIISSHGKPDKPLCMLYIDKKMHLNSAPVGNKAS